MDGVDYRAGRFRQSRSAGVGRIIFRASFLSWAIFAVRWLTVAVKRFAVAVKRFAVAIIGLTVTIIGLTVTIIGLTVTIIGLAFAVIGFAVAVERLTFKRAAFHFVVIVLKIISGSYIIRALLVVPDEILFLLVVFVGKPFSAVEFTSLTIPVVIRNMAHFLRTLFLFESLSLTLPPSARKSE